jgi:MFS family permease
VSDLLGRRTSLAVGALFTSVGSLLVFTQVKVLFVPGWFAMVAAFACLQAVVLAYLAELFPTEVRATLTAFVVTVQIVAGSVGLGIVAGLGELTSRSAVMIALTILVLPCIALLRRLPETAGRDVIALR